MRRIQDAVELSPRAGKDKQVSAGEKPVEGLVRDAASEETLVD